METSIKVYVANYAGHDFKGLEEYGEVTWITRGFVSFSSMDRLKYMIAERVAQTNPNDYLCLAGVTTVAVLAAISWFALHNQINLLVYDKDSSKKYRKVTITKDNLTEIFKVINDGTHLESETGS